MATGNAARFLESSMAAQMPAMKQQQEGMRRFLQGRGQRVGAKGAGAQARQAVDVYATQAGNVAAKLGASAERMGQQQDQFETIQAQRDKEFKTQQENWQSTFDQRNKDQARIDAMNTYQQTGALTPEMMEIFGLGDPSRGGQRDVGRQLDILGIGSQGGGPTSSLQQRAQNPSWQAGRAGRNQQAWLQSQFG